MEKRAARRWEDILAEELGDPEFRAQWEHTALARAFALILVQYRAEHHVSQTALAKLLGVKQPTVARWEIGEHNPTWDTLLLLAQKLGITISLTVEPTTSSSASIAEELARLVKNDNVSRIESPLRGTSATIITRTSSSPDQELVRV
jgi:transcriptional regulator with XRE-family HTH domain